MEYPYDIFFNFFHSMDDSNSRKRFPCVLCKKRTKPNDRKKCENVVIRKFLRKNFMINSSSHDVLCNKCRHHYYLKKTKGTFTNK